MTENQETIDRLRTRLDKLVRTQIEFQRDVTFIRSELERLRNAKPEVPPAPATAKLTVEPDSAAVDVTSEGAPRWEISSPPPRREKPPHAFGVTAEHPDTDSSTTYTDPFSNYFSQYSAAAQVNLEKFIGENLISKIGIVILVLGVGIGAKYAIDNGWISPLMRIIFGYAMGVGLLGFAFRLKPKYLNFSAVLLSGGMAIMYFVTYFAYAYYLLMPQSAAFALMAMFTVFTVGAALAYDRQVIAHIGLVGAYAVPFLLSDNSGNYLFLFTYMAGLNAGILAIAIKRYWNPLFYTSYGFTWTIYYAWFISKYSPTEHFYLALAFLAVFFAVFYVMKVVHGVTYSENSETESLISVVVNGCVFYAFALAISNVAGSVFQYASLFSYLAVISLAILITSFRFYGRALIFLSYPFTWLIFGNWFFNRYDPTEHFVLASIFAAVFFGIYYFATLFYRLATDDIGMAEHTSLVLTNSFVFYGFGYAILDSRENLRAYEGLFTAAHAALHSIVAQIVSRFRSSATDAVQILAVLIITFSTIAIPVQFDGNTVTLIFSVEAAALFWFARERVISLFEYFSYPVMLLATGSLLIDWLTAYSERSIVDNELNRPVILNGDFVTATVFVAAFSFIYLINRKERTDYAISADLVRPVGLAIGAVGLFVFYNTFRTEISNYFHLQTIGATAYNELSSLLEPTLMRPIDDIPRFNAIWQVNYTIFFLIMLAAVNLRKVRSAILAFTGIGFSILSLFIFSTIVMYLFYELRVSYMFRIAEDGASADLTNIAIRYISYAFAAGLLYTLFRYKNSNLVSAGPEPGVSGLAFDAILYSTTFVLTSCELINLMVQLHILDGDRLGLSILWAAYSLMLIVIGIAWNKTHLRIAAMVLLAVTLLKLFLYDVADLPTIPKTILFISIGILMLVVSFLYNKYRNIIFATKTDEI